MSSANLSRAVINPAAASEEQSRGIEQVHQAVNQMDEVTQQNAALVEQATAAAQSLEEQAQTLKDAVSVFKLADSSPFSRESWGSPLLHAGSGSQDFAVRLGEANSSMLICTES